jgi:hypothetical protein
LVDLACDLAALSWLALTFLTMVVPSVVERCSLGGKEYRVHPGGASGYL